MFPNFNPAKLKPRQSPPIQEYSVFRVFATTELLEGILLQLPLHDMLRSQQVKKPFRATVQKSVEIKRALFLSSTESIEPAANPLTNPFFIQKAAELIPNVRGVDFKFRFPRDPNAEGEVVKLDARRPSEWYMEDHSSTTDGSCKNMWITRPVCDIDLTFDDQYDDKHKRMEGTTLTELLAAVFELYCKGRQQGQR